ncbi:hypothetical protein DFS34DRAFT_427830 [Phlyctochytrium arcticum]|nr:hypothetical protein DFS34DRAFT_427830 [Phlyctochytrium arcticum]
MGSSQKTETSEEFKKLENDTDLRYQFTEKMHESLETYLKSLGKRKESVRDKSKKLPLEVMAEGMIQFGALLGPDSAYGQALVKFGEQHEEISKVQTDYLIGVRETYVATIDRMLAEMKDYAAVKSKLARRRLDFDAKLNKVHKSRKENPNLEEETRVAQAKYEESLHDTTNKMIMLNSSEDEQLEDLLAFVDKEVEYHRGCLALVESLQRDFASIPRRPSLSAYNRPYNPPSRQNSAPDLDMLPPSAMPPLPGGGPDRKLTYASSAGSMVFPMVGQDGSTIAPPAPSRGNSCASLPQLAAAPAARKRLRVEFDFDAEGPDELSLRKGEILELVCEIDDGWWEGEMLDGSKRGGMFPSNYVAVLPENAAPRPPSRPSSQVFQPSRSNSYSNPPSAPVFSSSHTEDLAFPTHSVSQQRPEDRPYSHISRLSYVPNNAPLASQHQHPSQSNPTPPPPIPASPASRASSYGDLGPFQTQPSNPPSTSHSLHASPASSPKPPHRSPSAQRVLLPGNAPSSSQQNGSAAPACGTCGCEGFVPHAFKKNQCASCFHTH